MQYQNVSGQSSCLDCPSQRFTPRGLQGSSQCQICPPNSYLTLLPVKQFYEQYPRQESPCISCIDHPGLDCVDGTAKAREEFWLVNATRKGAVLAVRCLRGYCKEGASVASNQQCSENRDQSADNWMCARCQPGFMSSFGACVQCDSVNSGYIFLIFVCALGTVLFLHFSSRKESSARLKIFTFFLSAAWLLLSADAPVWIHFFLTFLNFGGNGSFGLCIVPLRTADEILLGMFSPLGFIVLFCLIWLIHFIYWRCGGSASSAASPPSSPSELESDSHSWLVYDTKVYVRSLLAIVLFSYSTVMSNTMKALHCSSPDIQSALVDSEDQPLIEQRSVLFNWPDIDCDSPEYTHTILPVASLFAAVYVLGVPLIVCLLVYVNATSTIWHKQSNPVLNHVSSFVVETYCAPCFLWTWFAAAFVFF
ncbi:MAG TPA: hypothetical protein V6C97_14385 [Oculatellaceae cyanobacterium]